MKRLSASSIRRLFRLPPSHADVERDVQDELQFHIDSRILALQAQGESPERAREIAAAEYGDVAESRAELTALDRRMVTKKIRANFFDVFRQDLASAARTLVRSPGFTVAIILTLGLGIGANAAVFTVLDRLFFQTPPGVVDGGSIRRLYVHRYPKDSPNLPDGLLYPNLRANDFFALRDGARNLARIEGDYLWRRGLMMPSKERMLVSFATPGFFELLGVRAATGRLFTPDENSLTGPSQPVVVLSEPFWRKKFNADPDVLGKPIRVDENGFSVTFTVIGVAQSNFEGTELQTVDMWAPLGTVEGGVKGADALHLLAKLKPETNIELLDNVLTAQYKALHATDGWAEGNSRIISAPMMAGRAPEGTRFSIPGVSDRSLQLIKRIAGVAIVVLIIAVANVASLLLMRAIRRRREIAVRLALGVSRGRLFAQVLIESLLIGAVGGAAALVFAALTGSTLRLAISNPAFRWSEGVLDQRVVVVTALLALLSGVLSGLAPALFALRADVASYLKSSSSVSARSGTTLRNSLLIVQCGLCMALIASAGVFVQSLRRAATFDRGFNVDQVVQIEVRKATLDSEERIKQIANRLREVPGVTAVGRTMAGMSELSMTSKIGPTYKDTVGVGPRGPYIEFVEPDFFAATDLRTVAGHTFSKSENFGFVVVLNESLARRLWPKGNAIGQCIHVREPQSPCREVVGIVRDVAWDVMQETNYRAYIPFVQAWRMTPSFVPNYLMVRMSSAATMTDVKRLFSELVPSLADEEDVVVSRVSSKLEPHLQPWVLASRLFLGLGLLGLLAAAAGIYGLISYDVTQRTREIGVRVALGARTKDIYRVVLAAGVETVFWGLSAGIVAALIAGRVMKSMLFETQYYDVAVLGVTAATLIVVALVASLIPARRAVRVDPRIALSAD